LYAKVFSIVKKAAAILLLLAAFAQFGVRALRHRDDIPLWIRFRLVCIRTWLHAGDRTMWMPCAPPGANRAGAAAGNIGFWSSVYPPTSLTMLAPVACCAAATGPGDRVHGHPGAVTVQFAVLLDMTGLPLSRRDPRWWLLIRRFAFFRAGAVRRPGRAAIDARHCAVLIAIWCSWRQRERLAGHVAGAGVR
jgi:hypothetical protein